MWLRMKGSVKTVMPESRKKLFNPVSTTALVFSVLFMVSGCGLPSFSTLPKPIALETDSDTTLGFRTPVVSAGIQLNGYSIYYKIYRDFTDLNPVNENNDEWYFDENNYDENVEELQPGNIVPIQRGFVRAGEYGSIELPANQYNVPHSNSGDEIIMDFNNNDSTQSNNRSQPIVGIGPDPGVDPNKVVLARGFIDPRFTNKTLRRFVNDWFFSTSTEGFYDGDLRRPPGKQPGTKLSDFTGTPIISGASHGQFIIAFVVYSVGFDVSSGQLSPIYSKPVYLGEIEYTDIQINNNRDSESE